MPFSETLPSTATAKNSSIHWTPSRVITGAGNLTIHASWCSAEYLVLPIVTDFAGRAFVLAKVSQGSDPDEANYTVFIAGPGEHDSCTCKGHTYHPNQPHGCKHIAAMKTVLVNSGGSRSSLDSTTTQFPGTPVRNGRAERPRPV